MEILLKLNAICIFIALMHVDKFTNAGCQCNGSGKCNGACSNKDASCEIDANCVSDFKKIFSN